MSFNPELWVKRNETYLTPSSDTGLLLPESQYINFGQLYGDAGYGFRDNAGTMQFRNNLGLWTDFGAGGGSGTPGGFDRQVQFNDAGAFGGSSEVVMPEASDIKLKVTGNAGGGFGYVIQAIENTNAGGRAELSFDTDDGAFAGFITQAGSATTNKQRQFDIGTRLNASFGLWTNDLQQVTINPSGNVGIGTAVFNPTEKLEVDGNVIVGDATGNRFLYIESGSGRRAKITQEGASVASPLRISSNGALQLEVDDVPVMTIADTGPVTFAQDVSVPDEAYNATAWNGSLEVPTKNAVRDKVDAMDTTIAAKVASVSAGTNTTVTGTATAPVVNVPTMTATVGGAVPTPPNNTTTFLRGDGTFAAPSSGFADPLTTNGDIIARISGSTTRLAQGANDTFLGVQSGVLGYYTPPGGGSGITEAQARAIARRYAIALG